MPNFLRKASVPKRRCQECEYQGKRTTLTMRPLKCLIPAQHAYVQSEGGYYELNEFSSDINKYSRAKIRALKREKGEAWIGLINPYKSKVAEITQYTRGVVINFGASFVIPRFDQT